MDVYCFQTEACWEDPRSSAGAISNHVAQVAENSNLKSSLLIFPELSLCGFSMNVDQVGEAEDGFSYRYFSNLASTYGAFLIAGIAGRDAASGLGVNEAVCFDPDGNEAGRYRKMQPFSPSGEAENYEAGRSPVVIEMNGWKVAPFICYDLRFPELFRLAAKEGAELFPVIANWPARRVEHWLTLLKARAIENQAYVIGVNRSGGDPNFEYPGASLIVDPHGEEVASAGGDVCCLTGTLNREEVKEWRAAFPALKDMKLVPTLNE